MAMTAMVQVPKVGEEIEVRSADGYEMRGTVVSIECGEMVVDVALWMFDRTIRMKATQDGNDWVVNMTEEQAAAASAALEV